MKKYFEFILEKQSTDNIYHLYYSDIQKDIYDEIIQSDPTSKPKLMGKYGKWLLSLYKSDNLKTEDLYKATDYLELFHKYKHKLTEKDISKYTSLPSLFKAIEPYYSPDTQYINEDEHKLKGQFKEVFTGKNYRVIIPLTLNASKYFGRNTQWCTTSTDMFKEYTKNQNPNEITKDNLYILYTDSEKDKKQFHFRDQQFMNIYDNGIDLEEFYKINPDIYVFFKKYFNPIPVNIYLSNQNISSLKDRDTPKSVDGNFNCRNNKLTSLEGAPEIVDGDFYCRNNLLTSLEGAPEIVDGDFNCRNNLLTSLEGAPKSVDGYFYCSYNKLTTLKGAPEIVDGDFYCRNNLLTSLEGAPEKVNGDFYCYNNNLTTLMGAPKSVGGNFYCRNNLLTSLEGAPEKVNGDFYCYNNNLTSLEGAPKSVGGLFYCYDNKLTTLEGAPKSVGGHFYCYNNKLTSLEGAPKSVGGNFNCSDNNLISLEGAPKSVDGNFYCRQNDLTSLEGAPEIVDGDFNCRNNNLTNLEGAPKSVGGDFYCSNNPHLTEKDIEWLRNNCDIKGKIIF
jgi:hypothetical protein